MQIASTRIAHNRPSGDKITAGTSFSAASVDANLSQGVVPADVYVDLVNKELTNQPSPGTIQLTDRGQAVKKERVRLGVLNLTLVPAFVAPGALLGLSAFPSNPLVGAAMGAGIGLAMVADNAAQSKGKVLIEHDGQKTDREWYGTPSNFQKTPQELRTLLHSTGVLGDRVEIVPPELEGTPKPELLSAVEQQRQPLLALAKQRRLLADFGGKSRYGQAALQQIDAVMARELLGRGKPVHVVTVKSVEDTPHQLTSEAHSGVHHQKNVESHFYLERKLDYQLQRIDDPAQLQKVPEGKGLPESTAGLPRDLTSFTQTVYQREEKGGRTIVKDSDQRHSSLKEVLVGDTKVNRPAQATAALRSMVDPSTRGYVIAGAVAGAVAGMAVPGLDPAVGLTLGGFGGHFVGRAAVARTAEGLPDKPTLQKVATGLGAVAGAGIGVLSAMQTGDAGLAAGGFIGAFGGMAAGVLLGQMKSRSFAKTAGMAGFTAGGYLGVAAGAFGFHPATAVAMGALGAVAGGSLGYIMTQGKR